MPERRFGRAVAHGLAMLLAAVAVSPSLAQDARPLAAVDGSRIAVKAGFARFLALRNAGDPRAQAFLADGFAIEAPDAPEFAAALRDPKAASRTLVAHEILLDDEGGQLAVEIELRPAGGAWPPVPNAPRRTIFFTLKDAKIAAARVAIDGSSFFPRGSAAVPGPVPPPPLAAELPPTVAQPFMTRAKFLDYLRLFGRFDERFVRYYHPEVVFGIAPATVPLHGRDEVLALYRPLRRHLDEDVVVKSLVIDSDRGIMAAEIVNTMTATGPVRLPMLRMEAGDRRIGAGVIFYGIKDGMVVNLRETS